MGSHVSTVPSDAPQAVRDLDRNLQAARFTSVSGLAVSAFDHLACLDEEIEMIWGAKHSVFKYLALVSRYSEIFYATVVVILRLGDWDRATCGKILPIQIVAADFTILSSSFVLALRTAAVYSHDRRVYLGILFVVTLQTATIIWGSTRWEIYDLPRGIHGCFARVGPGHTLVPSLYWAPFALTNLVLFVLMVARILPIFSRSTDSLLSWVILRDEIMYYGLVTGSVIATNVVMYQKTRGLAPAMASMTIVLSAILVFHSVLNLRSITVHPARSVEEEPMSMEEILATTHEPAPPPPRSESERTPAPLNLRQRLVRQDLAGDVDANELRCERGEDRRQMPQRAEFAYRDPGTRQTV